MNIFVLHSDPRKAAIAHCDKHVIKMILESAQMLSTACRVSGLDVGYKATHKNHPCTLWVSRSLDNWRWLKSLAFWLNEEYKLRFLHVSNHKSWDVIAALPEPEIAGIGLTPFALAMPVQYQKIDDPVASYRAYYMGEKAAIAKWRFPASKPDWFGEVK